MLRVVVVVLLLVSLGAEASRLDFCRRAVTRARGQVVRTPHLLKQRASQNPRYYMVYHGEAGEHVLALRDADFDPQLHRWMDEVEAEYGAVVDPLSLALTLAQRVHNDFDDRNDGRLAQLWNARQQRRVLGRFIGYSSPFDQLVKPNLIRLGDLLNCKYGDGRHQSELLHFAAKQLGVELVLQGGAITTQWGDAPPRIDHHSWTILNHNSRRYLIDPFLANEPVELAQREWPGNAPTHSVQITEPDGRVLKVAYEGWQRLSTDSRVTDADIDEWHAWTPDESTGNLQLFH
jgi:hypothetical protein